MKKIFLLSGLFISLSVSAQEGLFIEKKTETINTKIIFSKLTIEKNDYTGELSATVVFNQFDEDGKRIDNFQYTKTGEEYNDFWAEFTSGKFLYKELNLKNENGVLIPVPNSVETDFINK